MIPRLRNAVKNLVNHVKDKIFYPLEDWVVYRADPTWPDFIVFVWITFLLLLLAGITLW